MILIQVDLSFQKNVLNILQEEKQYIYTLMNLFLHKRSKIDMRNIIVDIIFLTFIEILINFLSIRVQISIFRVGVHFKHREVRTLL